MNITLIATFAFGGIAALILARYYEPPPRLTVRRKIRLILTVIALVLLSMVGLRDPLPISVMYPVATGICTALLLVVVLEKNGKAGKRRN